VTRQSTLAVFPIDGTKIAFAVHVRRAIGAEATASPRPTTAGPNAPHVGSSMFLSNDSLSCLRSLDSSSGRMAPSHSVSRWALSAACLSWLLMSACSNFKVTSDHDRSYDFSNLRTYDWTESLGEQTGARRAGSGWVLSYIQDQIESQLAAKGYTPADDDPDFLVAFDAWTEAPMSGSLGSGYSGWRGGGSSDTGIGFREGTMVVDVVDPRTNTMVWRGQASGGLEDPPISEEQLDKLVARILDRFPPR